MNPLICIYEDRSTHLVAIQLLIFSLRKYHPELNIRLRFPKASSKFTKWCRSFPNITLVTDILEGAGSYNIKPHMLIDGLNTGASVCLWLDTDIILNGKILWLNNIPAGTLVSTLDPFHYSYGSNYRAEAFGLIAQEKNIPGAVNSALVMVDQTHRDLLSDWAALLKIPEYQHAQKQMVGKRNPMMLGDQDALSALMGSVKYSKINYKLLLHPFDILHNQGNAALSFLQRWKMKNDKHLPALIHAMASTKPWMMKNKPNIFSEFRSYYDRVYLETSPYVNIARKYEALIEEDTSWLDIQSPYSKLMMFIFNGDSVKAGAMQSIFHQIIKRK